MEPNKKDNHFYKLAEYKKQSFKTKTRKQNQDLYSKTKQKTFFLSNINKSTKA